MKAVLKLILSFCILFFSYGHSKAQNAHKSKSDWQNLDLQKDTVFGISTQKAYDELLKGKKHIPVIVAILDGGVNISHSQLSQNVWVNLKEIPGNDIDDDKNGYKDDLYGWNFIGSEKGNVVYDNLEVTRRLRFYINKYSDIDTANLKGADREEFKQFRNIRQSFQDGLKQWQRNYLRAYEIDSTLTLLLNRIGNYNPDIKTVKQLKTKTEKEWAIKKLMTMCLENQMSIDSLRRQAMQPAVKFTKEKLLYHYNLDYDPRPIVGDDYNNTADRNYGNNDVQGSDSKHGTHVAGIIAAAGNTGTGINGVANDVRIMSVRIVPNGDERDKDVANAIRYAVDNGAKIINMSFGKSFTSDKNTVDSAVKYAMKNDVLIVHAAGNDAADTDKEPDYPNRYYIDGSGFAKAWLEVGASDAKNNEFLKASFSNYGKKSVDVFAPGVDIKSTVPGNKYEYMSGTSMAAPVVTGLAALIRSYYPGLTAFQVREIILRSAVKVNHKVYLIKHQEKTHIMFNELCESGGIVNAYNALTLAATYPSN